MNASLFITIFVVAFPDRRKYDRIKNIRNISDTIKMVQFQLFLVNLCGKKFKGKKKSSFYILIPNDQTETTKMLSCPGCSHLSASWLRD